MARRFDGKTAFITGASSGIGAELARQLAREGARVALAARRLDRLTGIQEDIESDGGQALALECDVTDRASVDAAVEKAVEAFGGIDLAVANAGFGVSGAFLKLTTGDWRRQFETNVFGLLETVYAVTPHLIASKGCLGLVSSVAGRVPGPDSAPYCASKFAVCGIAESLNIEFAKLGVAVVCIEPGFVDSDIRMTDNKGVFHDGAKDPVPSWLVVPTPTAVRAIVRALHRRKFQAVITGHGKFAVVFNRHFPRTLRTIMRLGAKKGSGKKK